MTETDLIRARLAQLADDEDTNPSPVLPPVTPDDA